MDGLLPPPPQRRPHLPPLRHQPPDLLSLETPRTRLALRRRASLFVLPPRSPKLNGAVERAQRTHTEEFYEVTPGSFHLPALNHELRHWERIYNTVRPHQALGYLTPKQFLAKWESQRKEAMCH